MIVVRGSDENHEATKTGKIAGNHRVVVQNPKDAVLSPPNDLEDHKVETQKVCQTAPDMAVAPSV
jgi:hypothetical protein